ncbi:MAG: prolipoprotein diacylglyceryl transferase [Candidatus Omnitrophica bacterium]|nr:prolipoprotein diacylglyceryl transferase [Candidatus Omnitrophota bacterium]
MHPILFEIGPFTLRSYGALIALAFFVGYFFLYREAKKKNFYPDKILDIELIMLISGILGARALHVLVNLDYYRANLPDMFFFWKGGLAFYGGLILAILASWVFIVKNKMPRWETADFIIPYIALGQAIGRVGCFFNGCCFGKETASSFGVIFYGDSIYRHPTQLYAAFALLCIFVILRLTQKNEPFAGLVAGLYLLLYGLQRFFIDFLRGDTPRYALNLTASQLISIGILLLAAFVFISRRIREKA